MDWTAEATAALQNEINKLETRLNKSAPVSNPEFPGVVKSQVSGLGGSQIVSYSKELDAKLQVTKAISLSERATWLETGMLPVRVDVKHPKESPTYSEEAYQADVLKAGLASINIAPLAKAYLGPVGMQQLLRLYARRLQS